MKKFKNQHSGLKTPLNAILGSKGHVIILRQLAETEHPLSTSELLDRTNLSRQGVYDVVRRLAEAGIVEYVGSGKTKQLVLRKAYPLADIILKLFQEEKKRFDDLIQRLSKIFQNLKSKPQSAWIFGKIAEGTDTYGDQVRIALLGRVQMIDRITGDFRKQLYDTKIEKKYDVTIDIIGVTRAELKSRPKLETEGIILLWGMDPSEVIKKPKGTSYKTHQDLDRQSLTSAKAWSELLKTHPEIIQRTIKYLKDRISKINSGEKQELQEWKHILESMSFQRLKKFIESDSERSMRLRQSLPFWLVLNGRERARLEEIKTEQASVNE
jgi:DNA-binding HxlR family transcriptional regulator